MFVLLNVAALRSYGVLPTSHRTLIFFKLAPRNKPATFFGMHCHPFPGASPEVARKARYLE
jgi:hypothetical protein